MRIFANKLSSPINSTKIHKIRLFIASPSKFIIKLKANSKPCFWCCVFEFLLLQQLVFEFVLVKFCVKVFANALRVFFGVF